jgi:hypothetical protein
VHPNNKEKQEISAPSNKSQQEKYLRNADNSYVRQQNKQCKCDTRD